MSTLININGQLYPESGAKISVLDRGFLFGDSVYEVTRTYHRKPALLEEHLDRLWFSAARISMHLDYSREELRIEIEKTLNAMTSTEEAYIRLIVTRGSGQIDLNPYQAIHQNFIIIVKPLEEKPSEWWEKGVHFIIADTRRNPENSLDPNIKTGNYLNNVMAHIEAKKRGAFDAIMLNQEGMVAEGTTNNIWMLKQGKLWTPPVKAGILKGITRTTLRQIALLNGMPVREESFSPEELKTADEVFCTSSVKEIVPITKIDDTIIGKGLPGATTHELFLLYRNFVEARS